MTFEIRKSHFGVWHKMCLAQEVYEKIFAWKLTETAEKKIDDGLIMNVWKLYP